MRLFANTITAAAAAAATSTAAAAKLKAPQLRCRQAKENLKGFKTLEAARNKLAGKHSPKSSR